MRTPAARGPLSDWIVERLRGGTPGPLPRAGDDPLSGDDLHLALYLCYELHYGGLDGVPASLEWDVDLLRFRARLEARFESAVRDSLPAAPSAGGPVDRRLRALVAADEGPSVSLYLRRHGTHEEFREFLIHRSAYQLKEADPHAWAIPRLAGAAKTALVEILADEYGGGDPRWLHASLFAESMAALGLDPRAGAYLDRQPGVTLAWVNLMSMFGLHRRLRGAIVGHLAAFEMTSCIPNGRYAEGLRRLGHGEEATRYFDEHVQADAVHEAIACTDLVGSLLAAEPDLEEEVIFGARALLLSEARLAQHLLGAWASGRSSLFAARRFTAV